MSSNSPVPVPHSSKSEAGTSPHSQLLSLFDKVAEAPGAIPRLRSFILDLAVRGKLVEQDPNDEPAAELLKRIAAEKERLIKEKKIKKPKALPAVEADEVPFEIPNGWSAIRLGEIASKTGSGSTPRGGKTAYTTSGTMFLRSQNVYDDGLRLNGVAYIPAETHERMSNTAIEKNDLLLNITGGSIGRCAHVPNNFIGGNINQHVAIIRIPDSDVPSYLHRVITSPSFQDAIFGTLTGAGREGLPKNKMDMITICIPPLAEQKRIVAKVDKPTTPSRPNILPRIMICDFENGSRMLPLLSKISDSQGGGSILLPFLDCIFSQIFMRGGILRQSPLARHRAAQQSLPRNRLLRPTELRLQTHHPEMATHHRPPQGITSPSGKAECQRTTRQ